MKIFGGVGRSQSEAYGLHIGSDDSLATVFGTLDEIREVISSMAEDLEHCAASAQPGAEDEAWTR